MLKKLISIILVICSMFLISCRWFETKPGGNDYRKRPEIYTTNYTNEEHIERLEEITRNIEFKDVYGNKMQLVDCQAYIVYSLDERPEYFYIIHQWKDAIGYLNNLKYRKTNYSHCFGFIENDRYYKFYRKPEEVCLEKGFWGDYGLLDVKKYANYSVKGYKNENDEFVLYGTHTKLWNYEYVIYYEKCDLTQEYGNIEKHIRWGETEERNIDYEYKAS